MAPNSGTSPTLIEANPWLRDERVRHEAILDVVERDSVIEGLPPLGEETRRRIREQLRDLASRRPKPVE